jgi:hypothetical protein
VANADPNPRLTPELEANLRRYVLGGLPESARSDLEEQLVTEPDVFEALGVVEDELIEEYLDGTGTELDRGAFERHFLTSPQRQARLRLAKSLRKHASQGMAAATARPQPVSGAGRWQPAWLALAAALVLSLAGNVWLANRSAQPMPAAVSVPGSEPGGTGPTFTLATGLLRSGGSLTRVSVPSDAAVVRLRLELPPADSYPTYRATVLDEDGTEVWTVAKLRVQDADTSAVVVAVPTELLSRGDYQVRLSGQKDEGEPEIVGTYAFRISTP